MCVGSLGVFRNWAGVFVSEVYRVFIGTGQVCIRSVGYLGTRQLCIGGIAICRNWAGIMSLI